MADEIRMVPIEAWHLAEIDMQEMQSYAAELCKDPRYRVMVAQAGGVTMLIDHGKDKKPTIICCCGIIKIDKGLGVTYAYLSKVFPKYAVRVTRAVKKYLEDALAHDFHRIETQADVNFPESNRWNKMLGFKYEYTKKQATAYRQDVNTYAMIREGD